MAGEQGHPGPPAQAQLLPINGSTSNRMGHTRRSAHAPTPSCSCHYQPIHPPSMGTAGDAPAPAAAAAAAGDEQPQPQPQPQPQKRTLVFTYGTLKRGFSNHALLQELAAAGDAAFVGAATTAPRLPLVCGPYRVPFLLNLPGAGHRVAGELYAVTPRGLHRLDDLEGVSRAHYERLPVSVDLAAAEGAAARVDAVAYYAHRGYADELWRRSGEEGFPEYSHAVAAGYVRRKDRPQGLTFLEQIRIFVSSQS